MLGIPPEQIEDMNLFDAMDILELAQVQKYADAQGQAKLIAVELAKLFRR